MRHGAFMAAMERLDKIDTAGVLALLAFAVLLGFNQVVIKVSTDGFQPVFLAGGCDRSGGPARRSGSGCGCVAFPLSCRAKPGPER